MPALPALRHTFQKLLCRFFGSSTLSISANHFPPLIPLSRLLSIESVQTPCSTHAHLALRVSLSCLGSFSEVTAVKFSSLIFFPSQSIFLRPLAPAIVTRLRSVRYSSRCLTACLRYYGRSDSCPSAVLRPVVAGMNSAPYPRAGLPCYSLITSFPIPPPTT